MQDLLERLLEGNRRFSQGQARLEGASVARRWEVRHVQKPFALILGCSDSRVPPEMVFDCGLGDLFVIRTAGHTVDEAVKESVLFGVQVLEIPLVLVLGHARCGAVSLALEAWQQGTGKDGHVVAQIAPAIEQCAQVDEAALPECVVKVHVQRTVAQLRDLIAPVAQGVDVRGAYYDLDTGMVEVLPT